jgi:hypothetical protein
MMALIMWGALFLFIDLLQVALITLKILNILQASWFWTFCPLWVPFLIYLLILFFVLVRMAIDGGKKDGK